MSGAILLQLILAGVIGSLAFFRRSIWTAIRTLFRLKRSSEDSSSDTPEPHAP
jgi:hypothetical protein